MNGTSNLDNKPVNFDEMKYVFRVSQSQTGYLRNIVKNTFKAQAITSKYSITV